MITKIRLPECDQPATWTLADEMAVKCLFTGTATPEQQKRAINWILHQAASKNAQSYRTDPCAAAFMEGRRFVASQIMGLVELDLDKSKTIKRGKGLI